MEYSPVEIFLLVQSYSLHTSAGKLTATEPSGNNEVSKPMAVITYLNSEMIMVQQRGEVISTAGITLADGSVDNDAMADNAINTDEIVDDAVTAAKLANSINSAIAANTAKVTNATHTGDVTGATSLTIATGAVDIAMLSASNHDNARFLRGDNTWQAAGGGLSSDSTSGSRSAGAGSGNVSYTGSSFTPTAIIVLAANDDNDDSVTVGFADSALDEGDLELTRMSGTPRFVTGGGTVIAISSNGGNDSQNASVASYNSDGVTLAWVKGGSGTQCTFRILYLK